MGTHPDARGDGARSVQCDQRTMVALHQLVPGYVGPERLPADVPALLNMRPARYVSSCWCDEDVDPSRACKGIGVKWTVALSLVLLLHTVPAPAVQLPPRPPKPI